MNIVNFETCEKVKRRGYRGNAGRKLPYLYNNSLWIVKFPSSTKEMKGNHLPSYTSSPISEYIGSHIYESLGIDVHETVLGYCEGKIVVGCKDFAVNKTLLEYSQIKNTISEDLIFGTYGSSSAGERLNDVLNVIKSSEDFADIRSEAIERFWDMFVVDAFIHNNDRNNGNWGILFDNYFIKMAPVYDNGNAFFNKRNPSLMKTRTEQENLIKEDAITGRSFFLDDNDKKINPLKYLETTQDEDCLSALKRFSERLDIDKINKVIDSIPNEAFGLSVIRDEQKEFIKVLLEKTYKEGLLVAINRLKRPEPIKSPAELADHAIKKAKSLNNKQNDLMMTKKNTSQRLR